MTTHKEAQVWFDGASLGNPGRAGAGALVLYDGARIAKGEPLGTMTNNQAEYHGLILGLRTAMEAGADVVHVRGDSQLIIRQMEGRYRVSNAGLIPLHRDAAALARRFHLVRYEWVRREANQEADALAAAAARAQP